MVEGGRGKDGGAAYQFRAPGELGSKTTLGRKKKFCLQFAASIVQCPIYPSVVCVSLPPSIAG